VTSQRDLVCFDQLLARADHFKNIIREKHIT
jgi:hypothetical protein